MSSRSSVARMDAEDCCGDHLKASVHNGSASRCLRGVARRPRATTADWGAKCEGKKCQQMGKNDEILNFRLVLLGGEEGTKIACEECRAQETRRSNREVRQTREVFMACASGKRQERSAASLTVVETSMYSAEVGERKSEIKKHACRRRKLV